MTHAPIGRLIGTGRAGARGAFRAERAARGREERVIGGMDPTLRICGFLTANGGVGNDKGRARGVVLTTWRRGLGGNPGAPGRTRRAKRDFRFENSDFREIYGGDGRDGRLIYDLPFAIYDCDERMDTDKMDGMAGAGCYWLGGFSMIFAMSMR